MDEQEDHGHNQDQVDPTARDVECRPREQPANTQHEKQHKKDRIGNKSHNCIPPASLASTARANAFRMHHGRYSGLACTESINCLALFPRGLFCQLSRLLGLGNQSGSVSTR
jgi:hypothetical protein